MVSNKSFPPSRGNKQVSAAQATQPDNDKGNPVSAGKGGIPASLKMKNAASFPAPGVEKNVNLF